MTDDTDAPLLAVLAAADREAPRVKRAPGAAMVEGRFTYWVGEVPDAWPEPGQVRQWTHDGEKWVGDPADGRCTCDGSRAGNDACRDRAREWFIEALDAAKRRTRRDVAGVIT